MAISMDGVIKMGKGEEEIADGVKEGTMFVHMEDVGREDDL